MEESAFQIGGKFNCMTVLVISALLDGRSSYIVLSGTMKWQQVVSESLALMDQRHFSNLIFSWSIYLYHMERESFVLIEQEDSSG